ncbi:MAG: hypothetical protein WKF92_07370 [Pyrinomonadaceae bacterium]
MKNLRNLFGWITLVAILTFSSTYANAGIIIAGAQDQKTDPCTTTEKVDSGIIIAGLKDGIIIAGFTGIIIAGITGIIIAGSSETPVNCGIIIAG